MKKEDCILFSGGIKGAEAEFGANAEKFGIEEVNYTFEGHDITRKRGLRYLNHNELKKGDVSLEYISKLMNRSYTRRLHCSAKSFRASGFRLTADRKYMLLVK